MKNLRARLYRKGYTQQEFADKLGVKQETVSRWVNGVTIPRAKHLDKICEFLDITLDEFLEDVDLTK